MKHNATTENNAGLSEMLGTVGIPATVEALPLEGLENHPDNPRSNERFERWVKDRMNNWNDALCDPITVSHRADGSTVILRGHVRAEAARRLGKVALPARVFSDLTPQQELVLLNDHGTMYGLNEGEIFLAIKAVVKANSSLDPVLGIVTLDVTEQQIILLLANVIGTGKAESLFSALPDYPAKPPRNGSEDADKAYIAYLKGLGYQISKDDAILAYSEAAGQYAVKEKEAAKALMDTRRGYVRARVACILLGLNGLPEAEETLLLRLAGGDEGKATPPLRCYGDGKDSLWSTFLADAKERAKGRGDSMVAETMSVADSDATLALWAKVNEGSTKVKKAKPAKADVEWLADKAAKSGKGAVGTLLLWAIGNATEEERDRAMEALSIK